MSDNAETLRNEFFNQVLTRHSEGPHLASKALVTAWLKATNASWVWLWLFNRIPGQWEFVCGASADGSDLRPPALAFRKGKCLGDLAVTTQQPVLNYRLPGITLENGIDTHRAEFERESLSLGCGCVDVIPILSPAVPENDSMAHGFTDLSLTGMVALHYRDSESRIEQPLESLQRMASLTIRALLHSYREKQLSLLVKLNELHARFLPHPGKPQEIRRLYIDALIKFISAEMNCIAVSIFHERKWSGDVLCIGTTGLYEEASQQYIAPNDADRALYPVNTDTWTGTAVLTANPCVRFKGDNAAHRCKYREAPSGRPIRGSALLLMPIPRTDGDPAGNKSEPMAAGVIRCSGHSLPNYPNEDRNFDSLDIQQLAFIAAQISPVLETFAFRIIREDAIAVLKHDLDAPLNMLRDALKVVEAQVSTTSNTIDRTVYWCRHYDLQNMQYAVKTSQNLVMQLSADPYEIRSLQQERTFLEGDIIAGLCNLMGNFALRQKKMMIRFGRFRGSDDGTVRPVPPIHIDRGLIERVFANLLSNAVKYGTTDTTILVDPGIEADGLHIWISNFGIGIADADVGRIFEPYFRASAAISMAEGAGLGLGIAKKIMLKHGGDLRLVRQSDPTIFDVFFPNKLFLTPRERT